MACLLTFAGSLCVLVAAGQRHSDRALGLVALAGVPALLAARRWSRPAVGIALAAAGLAVIGATVSRLGTTAAARPVVSLLGGGLLVVAGSLAVMRGRSWPVLGGRYDAPSARPPAGAVDAWAALDRGEDPTAPPDTGG